ncbi:MAG TPA: rRNA adenine dimethyltransferase family protein [Nitrososphaeraceae archaeon]|jgi:16S rRNA (adenine1518-N6/adenine1519-N6)-dimethyltransferase|nr:rRNA adenine dimethyltransferase family protein [Nitrososphaeraceae archaeon]
MNWSRYYGQNFLIDLRVTRKIIELSDIKSFENICEMGTGRGILTPYLCKNANFVKSFEIDNKLYDKVKLLSTKYSNLEIINEDILEYDKSLEFDVFVSNIPYSKSKEILSWLATKKFERGIIMVQDEFSQKIQSKPGDKNYRAISAITQYCFDIESLFKVNKKSFFPQPKVNSQVIKLISKNRIISKDTISKIQFIFSFKNKNINKLNKKLNTNFEQIDLKIKEMDPEKLISFSQLI